MNYKTNYLIPCITLLLVFISSQSIAQKGRAGEINWFSASVKGGYGTTMLINKNIFGDKNVKPSYFNSSFCYGGKLAFNFTNTISVNFEFIMNSLSQAYDVNKDSLSFSKKIKMSTMDFPILFRFTGENKGYAELGVAFSTLKSANDDYTNLSGAIAGDVKNEFKSSSTKLVIGLGNAIAKGETFDLNLGVRMTYALTDIAKNKDYPVNDLYYTSPNGESSTNPFTVMAMLEFHYYLGYFATSSCGRKKGFIFF